MVYTTHVENVGCFYVSKNDCISERLSMDILEQYEVLAVNFFIRLCMMQGHTSAIDCGYNNRQFYSADLPPNVLTDISLNLFLLVLINPGGSGVYFWLTGKTYKYIRHIVK